MPIDRPRNVPKHTKRKSATSNPPKTLGARQNRYTYRQSVSIVIGNAAYRIPQGGQHGT